MLMPDENVVVDSMSTTYMADTLTVRPIKLKHVNPSNHKLHTLSTGHVRRPAQLSKNEAASREELLHRFSIFPRSHD